jgi:hypothetical protein
MNRREFVAGLGITAVSSTLAHAQQAVPVIGFVAQGTVKRSEPFRCRLFGGGADSICST